MWNDFARFIQRLLGLGPRRISVNPAFEAERLATARRLRLLAGVGLLLLVLGYFAARPIARAIRGRHADTIAGESLRALERDDLRAATAKLQAAAALGPGRASVALAQARLMNAAAHPGAVPAWQRLVELEPGVAAHRLELALALARSQQPAEAARAFAAAGPAGRSARGQYIAGVLATAEGEPARALTAWREAVKLDPARRSARFALGRALLEGPAPGEGVALLEALRSEPVFARAALALLATQAQTVGDRARAVALARELAAPPDGTPDDTLRLCALLEETGAETEAAALLKTASAAAQTDRAVAARVLGWLLARQRIDAAQAFLDTLPVEVWTAGTMVPVVARLVTRDEAKAKSLRELLRRGDWSGAEYLRHACAARLAGFEGDEAARNDRWGRALKAAGERREACGHLVALAGEWRWAREKLPALAALAALPPADVGSLREWHETAVALRDTRALAAATGALLAVGERSVRVLNDHVAALLLSGEAGSIERAGPLAFELFTSQPEHPAVVATYAAALRAQGRAPEALALLDTAVARGLDPAPLAFEQVAVRSALGRVVEARAWAKALPRDGLFPEEAAFLRRLEAP